MTLIQAPPTQARARVIANADDALLTAARLAAAVSDRAAERERNRVLPYADIDQLKRSGLLGITVPSEYGGPDLPPSVLAQVVRLLAEADSNVAQIPHSHFVYLNLLRLAGSAEQQRAGYDQVLAGSLLANAQAERVGRTRAQITTTLRCNAAGDLILEGTKYYCTGALFAEVIPVLAKLDDPEGRSGLEPGEYVVYVPAMTEGVAVVDDWQALGQRLTASGTVTLRRVHVDPTWVVRRQPAFDTPNGYGAFAQLLHAAIDVGIARGALEAAAAFVRNQSRPWFEAAVANAEDDPLTVQRFGELAVEAATAEAVLERAGHAVDQVFATPTETAATRASLDVAVAKVVAERVSVGISSALFEVCGTRAAAADENLDRFWRNARTHTLHDPKRWKIQHLGRHALLRQAPPRHSAI